MVLALGMDSKKRGWKARFFLLINIKLSVLRKVWLLKSKIKDKGGVLGFGSGKGEKRHRKILQAVLASWLTACASGLLIVSLPVEVARGTLLLLIPLRPIEMRSSIGTLAGYFGPPGMGQYSKFWDCTSCLPWFCRLLWLEVTCFGHRASGIMIIFCFCLIFCFLFISVFQGKKEKTLSVSGTVTFLCFAS